ncbi:MAG: TetR/AcrR family transcriptional regulator [Candidatus Binatia bacterium]
MPAKTTPRSYLAAPLRRDHLLDVAARLVREGGWAALSMQGLAVAAGLSRQLVYAHFDSVDELYLAALTHMFERTYAATERVIRNGTSLEATVAAAYELFLDLPPEERRALRALAADMDPGRRRLARAKTRLRTRIAGLWVPYVRQQTGQPEAEAGALAWMLINAAWGLADNVTDGILDRRRALALFVRFVERTLTAWRTPRSHPNDRNGTHLNRRS